MTAATEYREWMAILEPPANLVAELYEALKVRGARRVPPTLPFGTALIASGSGAPPRAAFEAAAGCARAHSAGLRFGPPAWKGNFLVLEPDETTARLLRELAARFPPDSGAAASAGLAAGEARADEEPGGGSYEMPPLAFRVFKLSLWRAARAEAPASGWLLDPAASAWIRIRDTSGRA